MLDFWVKMVLKKENRRQRFCFKNVKIGKTKKSIVSNSPVEWTGDTASVGVGFDIGGGGLPSIFLMYGAKRGVKADKNLYNAVFGAAVRKKVQEAQKRAFEKALGEVMK